MKKIFKFFFNVKEPCFVTCPYCEGDGRGEGWKIAFTCNECHGSGKIKTNDPEYLREERRREFSSDPNNKAVKTRKHE